MTEKTLDELVVWQVAREVAVDVHRAVAAEPPVPDVALASDLRAAARDVMGAVAAGYGADHLSALLRGFDRAGAAVFRLTSLIYLARDVRRIDAATSKTLLGRVTELQRLIQGWQRAIRTHRAARRMPVTRVN